MTKPIPKRVPPSGYLSVVLLVLLLGGCSQGTEPPQGAQSEASRPPSAVSRSGSERVPPYFRSAEEAKPLPRTLPPEYFREYPVVETAYRIAREIPDVLAQQPCYCYCDRSAGHRGLLDCWASDHGAT